MGLGWGTFLSKMAAKDRHDDTTTVTPLDAVANRYTGTQDGFANPLFGLAAVSTCTAALALHCNRKGLSRPTVLWPAFGGFWFLFLGSAIVDCGKSDEAGAGIALADL